MEILLAEQILDSTGQSTDDGPWLPVADDPDAAELVARIADESGIEVLRLTAEEASETFDEASRHHMNMSGAEFIQLWESGKFDNSEKSEIMTVAMLLPFVGR